MDIERDVAAGAHAPYCGGPCRGPGRWPRAAPGTAPGTLISGERFARARITVREFGPDHFVETRLTDPEELARYRDSPRCVWVDLVGLSDAAVAEEIGRVFGLHALSLEDVLDPCHCSKVDRYESYTFIVLDSLAIGEQVETQPVSIVIGKRFVLTFVSDECRDLEPVRERLRSGQGRLRRGGADYLAYALLDTIVDHYFPVVEEFDDRLELVEDRLVEGRDIDPLDLARRARRDLRVIRHAIRPAREVLATLLREDADVLSPDTRVYVRDCHDHVVQLQAMVEASREIAATLLEVYLSSVGLRTNQAMKLLTVIATIFIPLTFITGVYGMNFDPDRSPWNMPELNWYWGYPFSMALMALVAVGLVIYFRGRRWYARKGSEIVPPRGE